MTSRFVAIGVPAPIRTGLDTALQPVRAGHPAYAWTDPGGWHVTLAFLGDLAEASRPAIVAAVGRAVEVAAADGALPEELTLAAAGSLGDRVLIARVTDRPAGRVAELGARVQAALAEAGLPVQRRSVRPHVTLARARAGRAIADGLVDAVGQVLVPARWEPAAVGVWSSHLRRDAPARYVVDAEVGLVS